MQGRFVGKIYEFCLKEKINPLIGSRQFLRCLCAVYPQVEGQKKIRAILLNHAMGPNVPVLSVRCSRRYFIEYSWINYSIKAEVRFQLKIGLFFKCL